MRILCDIGGTYARFCTELNGACEHVIKYEAAAFEGLQGALQQYCKDQNINDVSALKIATAAYQDGSVWRFVNNNKWVIDEDALKDKGWNVEIIMNDFEAATLALSHLSRDEINILKLGNPQSNNKCLIGPGTGLGLGYLREGTVQKTHGGHMPVASLNDEHGKVIQKLRGLQDRALVFENIISGAGFFKLKDLYGEEDALRLFHELFGIFAATSVITGHAYGGLYLTGGVLERFIEEDKFDFEAFERAFVFNAVDSVKTALKNTPIIHITNPYPALKGLLHA